MRNFDQFEGGLVHGGLEAFVAVPVAVGFFDDDTAFKKQFLQHQADVELGIFGVFHAEGDVFEIAENCEVEAFMFCHWGSWIWCCYVGVKLL